MTLTLPDLHTTPRLYVAGDLSPGATLPATHEQAHYLQHVMRLKTGDALRLFNGRDGEYRASIGTITKKTVELIAHENLRAQTASADLWLCAAPIKKAHFDYMIEKATELGISCLQPMLTQRTQIREVNTGRATAIAVEAAEQSERLDIPRIKPPLKLSDLAATWEPNRLPIICAEWGEAVPVAQAFAAIPNYSPPLAGGVRGGGAKAAIFTGPEGGFAAEEFDLLRQLPNAQFIRLGPRILRADTAAIAALSCWQALRGDWDN